MEISKDKWASIHYTLKDDDGNILDSSVGKDPLGYIHGNGYLISGLERELEGKRAGDTFSAVIEPADAYGEYDSQLVIDIPRERFESDGPIELGMQFQVMTPSGMTIVRAVEIGDDVIKVDGNHELAGMRLHFDVEVLEVRNPSEEELSASYSCGGCGSDCGGCEGGCANCS